MWQFLSNNRDELLKRCREKVALRPSRSATQEQLAQGVPLFFDQLTRTLEVEESGDAAGGKVISGPSGGDVAALSEMGVSAAAHGKELLGLGYTVDQVVHDYGDLCQSITDLAVERDAPFSTDQFRTLNRCLDNAIADAVTAFSGQRDVTRARQTSTDENERLGVLVHELRNYLQTAKLAADALETGRLMLTGSTGALLKRSLGSMASLLTATVEEVRAVSGNDVPPRMFPAGAFLSEARDIGMLQASVSGCTFQFSGLDTAEVVIGNRELLLAALVNLIQNAFKFTHSNTEVSLSAHAAGGQLLIEVGDHCGGLSPGSVDKMFEPFTQANRDRTGLGLGLSIAKRSVEADGGTLRVADIENVGCKFMMSLRLQ